MCPAELTVIDPVAETGVFQKIIIGLGGDSEAIGHLDAVTGQAAVHFAQ